MSMDVGDIVDDPDYWRSRCAQSFRQVDHRSLTVDQLVTLTCLIESYVAVQAVRKVAKRGSKVARHLKLAR